MKNIFIIFSFFMTSCTAVVFQPSHEFYFSPERTLQATPENLEIPVAKNIILHGWRFMAKTQPAKGVIIQFHGNAENLSSHYISVTWLLNYGYDVVAFDYRGYGLSMGVPSFPEVVEDGKLVLEFVQNLYGEKKIPLIVYGQSLGSLIAYNSVVRSSLKIDRMIMEGGIYSLNQVSADVLSRHWVTWIFQPFGYVLVTSNYNFGKVSKDFPKIPIFLLHSKNDPIIPYSQSEKIFNALPDQACFKLIPESEHINIGNVSNGKYRPDILEFLNDKKCK